MRIRKYLIGAVVGVIGALAFSGVASAAVLSQTETSVISPAKISKKTFAGATQHNIIATVIDNPATTQSPKQTVFTLDRNTKFVNGNVPPCPLSSIQGKFTAQAQAACPQSIVGNGSVEVNNGAVKGTVTFFSGGPNLIYVQTDIGPGATTLTIIGNIVGKVITFSNIPNTPGLILTKFDTTFLKRKTGKSTFYFMARCKAGKWIVSETTTFYDGTVKSASSTQTCKGK